MVLAQEFRAWLKWVVFDALLQLVVRCLSCLHLQTARAYLHNDTAESTDAQTYSASRSVLA